MRFLQSFLRKFEGDGEVCICCRCRVSEAMLSSGGICICKRCYDSLIASKVSDYYDVGGDIGRLYAPFTYKGRMRQMVLSLKFRSSPAYAKPLAGLIFDALPPYYDFSEFDLVVPVPLHSGRLFERGYNQAALIAEELAKLLNIPLAEDVLFRTRSTKRQMSLTRAGRMLNVKGAFLADRSVSGKRILLIDDIYTVGATAGECAAALLAKGAAKVNAVVLCTNFNQESYTPRRAAIPPMNWKKIHAKG